MFVDTHCHFDFAPFAEYPAASLRLAMRSGVKKLVVPAVTAERFAAVMTLAQHHAPVYAGLGLHPLYHEQHQAQDLQTLACYLQQQPNKLVAVGEIGLDEWAPHGNTAWQLHLLQAQLRLAKRYDYPVILHSRRTHDKLTKQLRAIQLSRCGVIHGFAGSTQQAQMFIKLGYYIGVGGVITWPRAQKTRKAIAQLPLHALLLETDAPDMPLSGLQGEPNRPERIALVWQALCALRKETPEAIAEALWHNSHRLFVLP